ncbi:MAG TPA: hypothetical protein VFS09_07890 [Candidatus Eisenbacteria bacterium]|nr:hypothetical protein [Candidatus Eisenbacteria bacterium]
MSLRRALGPIGLLAILAFCGACSRAPSTRETQAWEAELGRLQAEQDSLRARSAELVAKDARIQGLPKGDVVIAVPTAFLRSVVERVFTDVVSNVTLRIRGIKAHVAKSVKKIVTIGEFVLDVDVKEVTGKLHPGRPDMKFGADSVSISLPLEISEGHGDADLHFVWDGKRMADVTCGDLDITQSVSGDVIPASYVVTGALHLKVRGRDAVGVFNFPETRLRLRVKPSKESWAAVDSILAEKHGVCGWVLDKVNVPQLLTNIVEEKGINVKLPLDKIKPFAFPAGVRDSIRVGERSLFVDAKANSIRIDPDAVWYSATVSTKSLK